MQKLVLFLLFNFCFATTVLAQQQPALGRAEPTAGRRDTLRAVRNLFERRRANSTTNGVRTTSEVGGSEVATAFGLLVGLPAAIGVGKLVRFSDKREEAITVPYTIGQPLPRYIARRLRRKDFE
jgi:hypothetical protein